eukprot:gene10428-21758_t
MSQTTNATTVLTEPLPSFICSLTMETMVDPVILVATGQTYERASIENWLSEHNSCPLSGLNLPEGNRGFTPNISLRNSIDEWRVAADRVIDELNHVVPFENIRIDRLLVSARTKDISKGTLLGRPVAVCVLKGPAAMFNDRECKILFTLGRHPNIVRFIARSKDNEGHTVLVLELAPEGRNMKTLMDELDDQGSRLSLGALLTILRQVAEGMEELAANNIFHKDLSARNILVFSFDAMAPERILVKVSDFGMSSIMETSSSSSYYYSGESAALPIRWMAPETLSRNKWSEKSDVYSFGVLVWELLSGGQVPWGLAVSDREVQTLVMAGNTLPLESDWSPILVDLMSKCGRRSPQERPTFTEVKSTINRYILSVSGFSQIPAAAAVVAPVLSVSSSTATSSTTTSSQSRRVSGMQVFVKTLTSKKITLDCGPDTTILEIKQKVHDSEGIRVCDLRLIFGGRHLEDSRTLSDCKIKNGDLIDIVLKMKGDIGVFGVHDGSPGIDLLRNLPKRFTSNDSNSFKPAAVTNGMLVSTIQQIVKQVRFDSQRYLSLSHQSVTVSDEVTRKSLYSSAESLMSPVLSTEECEVLRNWLDTKYHHSSSDFTTDFKLPLTLDQLVDLIGHPVVSRLCDIMGGNGFDEIVLRRSSAVGQCINFHLDHSLRTMQVALNRDEDYEGGRLVFALDNGTLCVPRRPLGSFTVHDNSI